MGRPPKLLKMIETEGVSHRTKAELELRRQGEAALLTGQKLTEWAEVKSNTVAHREYRRQAKLLGLIDKGDDLYRNIINRYCLLYAECLEYQMRRDTFYRGIEELKEEYQNGSIDKEEDLKPSAYYKLLANMQKNIAQMDKNLAEKRRMMLDVEKECIMTPASAMRAVPKKPEASDEVDPMETLLRARRG